MEEEIRRLLAIVSSRVNNEILALLANGSYSTREIARILRRDESDVSRRLNAMKRAGLVEARWVRSAGRNVKLYSLSVREVRIRFAEGKVEIIAGNRKAEVKFSQEHEEPVAGFFAGREEEVRMVEEASAGLIVIKGLPGIGKTSLAAIIYARREGVKAWINMSENDYLEAFAKRIALALLERRGDVGEKVRSIIRLVEQGDYPSASRLTARIMEETRALLVIDNYDRCSDERIHGFIADVVARIKSARLIIVTRTTPTKLVSAVSDKAVVVALSGLSRADVGKVLRSMGVNASSEDIDAFYELSKGHPGLLRKLVQNTNGLLGAGSVERRRVSAMLWEYLDTYLSLEEKIIVNLLACINEPLTLKTLRRLTGLRLAEKYVYSLIDKGVVEESNGRILLTRVLEALEPRHGIEIDLDCRAAS